MCVYCQGELEDEGKATVEDQVKTSIAIDSTAAYRHGGLEDEVQYRVGLVQLLDRLGLDAERVPRAPVLDLRHVVKHSLGRRIERTPQLDPPL